MKHLRHALASVRPHPELRGPVVFGALVAVVLGVLPHALYSLQVGRVRAFKAAFDEDIYIDLAVNGPLLAHRLLSALLVRGLYNLLGRSVELAWIASDAVFPAASAALAVYVAGRFAQRSSSRILLAACFLFGQELFSGGSAAVWPRTVENLRPVMPAATSLLVPYYYTSYFSLYRTPEPQVSWVVMWVFLALVVRMITDDDAGLSRSELALLAGASVLLPFCYVFVGVPMILLGILLAGVLWSIGKREAGAWLGAYMAGAGLVTVTAAAWSRATAERLSFLFPSRLPILTPSALVATVALTWTAWSVHRGRLRLDGALPAAAFLIVPLALTNQQVVTGWMIVTGNWERYVAYPTLLVGLAVLAQAGRRGTAADPVIGGPRASGLVTLMLLTCVLAFAEARNYSAWRPANDKAVAGERAAEAASASLRGPVRLVLDDPTLGPLLALRVPTTFHPLLSYTDLVRRRIGNLSRESEPPAGRGEHEERLFEHFARTARDPEALAEKLSDEARSPSGYYLGFLFAFRDFWPPASDGRAVRRTAVEHQIPGIVDEFARRLASPPPSWRAPALLLSERVPHEVTAGRWWRTVPLAAARVGGIEVHAYEQIPNDGPQR